MTSSSGCLKIGLYLPGAERWMDGETPHWDDLASMALRAEEIGLDSIFVADHFIQNLNDSITGFWDGLSHLAAFAAITDRVELGTGVVCTGFRSPALLAKMADTIDDISGGRVILGIGAGWHDYEYEAFGFPTDHKFSRFKEAIEIIHPLLKEGKVDYEGNFSFARHSEMRPRGPRPDGPPIMIAATGAKMLDLTARYADKWNGWVSPGGNQDVLSRLDAACDAIGRNPATLGRVGMVPVDLTGAEIDPDQRRPPVSGSPAEIAAAFRSLEQDGLSQLVLATSRNSMEDLELLAPVLEELKS